MTKTILERIEGEARLELEWNNGAVSGARIAFPNFRGYEFILKGRPALDALAITPRICGICGHAHLIAAARALEDAWRNGGGVCLLPPKAAALREVTQIAEMLQSHVKWFYFFLLPELERYEKASLPAPERFRPFAGSAWNRARETAADYVKLAALFSGQWPHASYAVPGGVTADFSPTDLHRAKALAARAGSLLAGETEEHLNVLVQTVENSPLFHRGDGPNRYLVLGEISGVCHPGRNENGESRALDLSRVAESDEHTFRPEEKNPPPKKYGWAKTALYDGELYETGPLARAVVARRSRVLDALERSPGAFLPRIVARMDEAALLSKRLETLLDELDPSRPSYVKPDPDPKELTGTGVGVVEAARGSLFHKVTVQRGIITRYDVITPTVWNLGPGVGDRPGIAEGAILGSASPEEADLILRSFDVCAVCTTH